MCNCVLCGRPLSDIEKEGYEKLYDLYKNNNPKKLAMIKKIEDVLMQEVILKRSRINMSILITDKLHLNYTYMSGEFTKVKGVTIEQFVIITRINLAKALIIQEDLTLYEVSERLFYNSHTHLSYQFKKITGQTFSQFKSEWKKQT